ncbi:MAG: DNA polymerase III subunit gamma/tau [Psittacicella sp.]
MAYEVLANKWRPKSLDQLVGQDYVVKALTNSLATQRIHNVYLFSGTRGVGKTSVARLLAKCISCKKGPTPTPCGKCDVCLSIRDNNYPDIIEFDAASNTGVDDIKNILENIQYLPFAGKYKIYLIDEVHMLSTSGFNALLKTLEEPPEYVKFILATTEPDRIPATVLSRCLHFNLKNIKLNILEKHLSFILDVEKISYETEAIVEISKAASGSLRDAISLLDQAILVCSEDLTYIKIAKMMSISSHEDVCNFIEYSINADLEATILLLKNIDIKGVDFLKFFNEVLEQLYIMSSLKLIPDTVLQAQLYKHLELKLDQFDLNILNLFYKHLLEHKKYLFIDLNSLNIFTMLSLEWVSKLNINNIEPARLEEKYTNPDLTVGSFINSISYDAKISSKSQTIKLNEFRDKALVTKQDKVLDLVPIEDNLKLEKTLNTIEINNLEQIDVLDRSIQDNSALNSIFTQSQEDFSKGNSFENISLNNSKESYLDSIRELEGNIQSKDEDDVNDALALKMISGVRNSKVIHGDQEAANILLARKLSRDTTDSVLNAFEFFRNKREFLLSQNIEQVIPNLNESIFNETIELDDNPILENSLNEIVNSLVDDNYLESKDIPVESNNISLFNEEVDFARFSKKNVVDYKQEYKTVSFKNIMVNVNIPTIDINQDSVSHIEAFIDENSTEISLLQEIFKKQLVIQKIVNLI